MAVPALVVQDLTKVYKNGLAALKGIDLTVEQGDFFALLGQMVRGNPRPWGFYQDWCKNLWHGPGDGF